MIFDYIETKEVIKTNVSYLNPGVAPLYWIVIAMEVLLFKAAHEMSDPYWTLTFLLGSAVLMLCVALSLRQLTDTDELTKDTQVRVARVVGILVPSISLCLAMSRLRLDPGLLLFAVLATFVQVFVFLFLVPEKRLTKDKSLNIPQLLVICSSLLFITHATMASLSARHFMLDLPAEVLMGYGTSSSATSAWTQAHFEKERAARQILDDESPLTLGFYRLTGDAANQHGIHRGHVEVAGRQAPNLGLLLALLSALWLVALARTVQHMRSLTG